MQLDIETLQALRRQHPAWRLLASESVALAASFLHTESRLLTLFELLRQMSEGSETDPQTRVRKLQRQRDEIDAEIARVVGGDIPLLSDTAL